MPKVKCNRCGKEYFGWALKWGKQQYCGCGNELKFKEVKKVKKQVNYKKLPYFETKVVKVKKEIKNKILILRDDKTGELYNVLQHNPDLEIGDVIWYRKNKRLLANCKVIAIIEKTPKEHPKGNWVNGENLDKIKFPCFCSYKIGETRSKGQINKGNSFSLYHVGSQGDSNFIDGGFATLSALIKAYDIHILKGKIIIFEEEE
ncbi:MAG: hypothetical protein PHI16_06290 [Methanocellales archaeon]|nr:hypothetical protein [Methanocellales archaeon]